MHRHGYKGRKFGRERDQREALIKGLAESLIIHESIETTLEKAKDLRPYVEKLVTKAIKGGLHNRRQVIASLQTLDAAHKLVDEIAPKMKRSSGYLRIVKTSARRGDNAQLARISFVDDLSKAAPVEGQKSKVESKTATLAAKPAVKKAPAKKPVATKEAK
jgi:large subunit ribosomal protein L17